MSSLILRTATRYLVPLLLLFSIYLLLAGHNYPGGGFVGGLAAAAGLSLYALAFDVASAKRMLKISPTGLAGLGLLVSSASGLPALTESRPYLTGLWTVLHAPGFEPLKVGTPILFDLGVYLVVLGVTMSIIFALAEEEG
ncbi:MAG: Na+/H+ antiporter subunit B [Kiritimatiellae bacterium]|nr:Na+/H+ antiporter subunit B [Kiritimatiellia bacterium]MDW8459319.1 Na+/H+ antiporter subunit B [Verrucomicrobiota bacterium]